jgi:hypothetical protein
MDPCEDFGLFLFTEEETEAQALSVNFSLEHFLGFAS